MSCDKEYICLNSNRTKDEGDILICSDCGKKTCAECGGDIQTIEEYDKAMKENQSED
jgi:hypothetical protein